MILFTSLLTPTTYNQNQWLRCVIYKSRNCAAQTAHYVYFDNSHKLLFSNYNGHISLVFSLLEWTTIEHFKYVMIGASSSILISWAIYSPSSSKESSSVALMPLRTLSCWFNKIEKRDV